jgi:hypothetical protein
MEAPEYLGDAVYVGHDGYQLILRLNSHENPRGQIHLDPDVLKKLIDYAVKIKMISIPGK